MVAEVVFSYVIKIDNLTFRSVCHNFQRRILRRRTKLSTVLPFHIYFQPPLVPPYPELLHGSRFCKITLKKSDIFPLTMYQTGLVKRIITVILKNAKPLFLKIRYSVTLPNLAASNASGPVN